MSLYVQVFGAKNYGAIGIILQRAVLICTLASFAIAATWSQMHRLLVALGVNPFHYLCPIFKL